MIQVSTTQFFKTDARSQNTQIMWCYEIHVWSWLDRHWNQKCTTLAEDAASTPINQKFPVLQKKMSNLLFTKGLSSEDLQVDQHPGAAIPMLTCCQRMKTQQIGNTTICACKMMTQLNTSQSTKITHKPGAKTLKPWDAKNSTAKMHGTALQKQLSAQIGRAAITQTKNAHQCPEHAASK